MATSRNIAPHESIIVHESLRAAMVSWASLKTMHETAQHPDLKETLEQASKTRPKSSRSSNNGLNA